MNLKIIIAAFIVGLCDAGLVGYFLRRGERDSAFCAAVFVIVVNQFLLGLTSQK